MHCVQLNLVLDNKQAESLLLSSLVSEKPSISKDRHDTTRVVLGSDLEETLFFVRTLDS